MQTLEAALVLEFDIIIKLMDGGALRIHPGHRQESDAEPQYMPPGSPLYLPRDAEKEGIGAALHKHPPGRVRRALSTGAPEPGGGQDVLFTPADLDAISKFDRTSFGNKTAKEFLEKWAKQQRDGDVSEDISNGERFPWWLWLANHNEGRTLCEPGVIFVFCVRRGDDLSFELR